jgi:DNA-binding NarL/FixJ family response regulator
VDHPSTPPQPSPRARQAQPARLVLADDHDLVRAGLRNILSGERWLEIVGEATNGREAVRLCRELQPDLILIDVRMPDMDGLAATREVKRQSPATSVILFTMYEVPEYVLDALRAGAAGYLLKGSPKPDILDAVRRVLAGDSLLHPDLVLQLLQRASGARPTKSQAAELTARERDVLQLVVLGQTNRQIAYTLGLGTSTVKSHLEHIIAKLEVSDRTQAAVRAIDLGLVRTKSSSEN